MEQLERVGLGPVAHDHRPALQQGDVERAVERVRPRRQLALDAVLARIQDSARAGRLVTPRDHQVAGLQHLPQLVADEVDNRLKVERGTHALLDAVDHGELAGSSRKLGAALGELAHPAFGEGVAIERGRGRVGERRDQLALGAAEAS